MVVNKPRCVIDTNVLISAALSKQGKPNQAVHRVLDRGVLLATTDTFLELKTRLHRPEFDRYLRKNDREELVRSRRAATNGQARAAQRLYGCFRRATSLSTNFQRYSLSS
jgi:predicted nucleic acid-binding protein